MFVSWKIMLGKRDGVQIGQQSLGSQKKLVLQIFLVTYQKAFESNLLSPMPYHLTTEAKQDTIGLLGGANVKLCCLVVYLYWCCSRHYPLPLFQKVALICPTMLRKSKKFKRPKLSLPLILLLLSSSFFQGRGWMWIST